MGKYYFGIDVGGTFIKFGLFDQTGVLLEKWMIPTRLDKKGECILSDLSEAMGNKMRDRGLDGSQMAGIGIGAPGQVDKEGKVLAAENLGWDQVSLAPILEDRMGIPVKAGNDANLAALGEAWKGAGCRDMVLVTVGTGIGCGVVLAGKIHTGMHGAAGELGHIHVEDRLKKKCACGKSGCLEQVASAKGIELCAKYILEESQEPSMLRGQDLSVKKVFDAAKQSDRLAIRTVECFGDYLGKALAMCTCVLDPERIVIGGGVSKAGDIILEYVQKYYRKYAFPACENVQFGLAKLGNDAGVYGAVRMFIEETP